MRAYGVDGGISVTILMLLLASMPCCKADPTMQKHDLDEDGHVNKTEFHHALRFHKHDHIFQCL